MPSLPHSAPPESLLRELNEVATDAADFAAELKLAQNLPEDFPESPLLELMSQLQALPLGTAEGCLQPLTNAGKRLAAIRRGFFQTEGQSTTQPTAPDTRPPLMRGMTLDKCLGTLVNAITTALDEYRALASITEEGPADTSPSRVIDPNAPDVIAAREAATNIEFALAAHTRTLTNIFKPESIRGDDLQRQTRDVRGLFAAAWNELRMPDFIPAWYRKILDTARDYPRHMRATMRGVKIGIDVARVMADAWHQFERQSVSAIFDGIEHAADGMIAIVDKRDAGRAPPPPAGLAPPFDLREVHRLILAGQPIPPAWRPFVVELNFSWNSKYLDEAAKPDISDHEKNRNNPHILSDLAPIVALANLQRLDLDNTQVHDLAPIAALANLQTLGINNTQVHDLAPIAALANLQNLRLHNTQVDDLAPIAALANLQNLRLDNTQVHDLAPIAALANLQNLYLNNTQVHDLAPIAALANLQNLWLDNTKVRDASMLRHPIAKLSLPEGCKPPSWYRRR